MRFDLSLWNASSMRKKKKNKMKNNPILKHQLKVDKQSDGKLHGHGRKLVNASEEVW